MSDGLQPGARVHLMGIGGFGINPIARVMHELGYAVSGCDRDESPLIPALREQGIPVEIGHSPAHLDHFEPDALVISSAIPAENDEVRAARQRGVPVYKRADILCELMRDRTGIAIAGTHGKTTTTGMLAWTLAEAGLDPTFIVGGVLANLGANARAGRGGAFVIEADEYDRMFLGLCPQIIVLTTLELDHPDMFASLDEVRALFASFVDLLPGGGLLVAGTDDPEVSRFAAGQADRLRVVCYGLAGGEWGARDLVPNAAGGMDFTALRGGERAGQVALKVPGTHNVQNALAVLAVAAELGVPFERAAQALGEFVGMGRRFEVRGTARGVTIIDDYAHHPTAIRATLEAARSRYPGAGIWAVWQPHTYSRTRALLDEFAGSFAGADHVIITDVYRSRDVETYGIGPEDVLRRMPEHSDTRHIGSLEGVVEYLAGHAQPGDVVIVMSAGDATRVCGDLIGALGGEGAASGAASGGA